MTRRKEVGSATGDPALGEPSNALRRAGKRPKFDKAASTTILVAALLGLGAGASGRLLTEAPAVVESSGSAPTELVAPATVTVVDASGRILATYDDARLTPAGRNDEARVTLSPGRARAPVASTRAS